MSVRKYALKRLIVMIPVLFGVTLLTFSLTKMLPGDPVTFILQFTDVSEEVRQQLRAQYNLDEPVWKQYLLWLADAITLDFGESVISGQNVSDELVSRMPQTVLLGVASFVIAAIIGIPAGILAAVRKGEAADEVSRVAALAGIATPNFWLGLMLILVFSVELGWFRTIPPDAPLLSIASLKFMLLPAVTLGTAQAALLMRLMRSSMLEELNKDYVQMARAKGLPERTVILKHVLRNSLIAVVTVAALQIAFIVDGAVVVEQVFSWPGAGRMLVDAIVQRDFPLIQATTLIVGVTIVLANFAVDLVYSLLDPRIRY
ncbi:ABC transporter permease [Halorubrum sp. AD140]|uniref:ABC transporter permease n=1 Tax=Halorubrum sp. AD140 TaxID=3050073 RepID=UPI002ACCDE3C|nr:ABC transporter permease [Halorubrum sp. AD140]MDZ5810761.1 ABC transporter permease [Halorubrum sp. AD140]